MQSIMHDGFFNDSSFSSIYTQKPIGPRFELLFLCCPFVIDDAMLIKIILLKFIQRDDAYGQCELYDAHLWQVDKGTCQKRFSGIRPLRGGGTPLSPKGFLAK